MMTNIVEGIGLGLGLIVAVGLIVGYFRQGTVKAALSTVELLKAQVESLQARVEELTSENGKLTATVQVLRDQVTQAAPVKELMAWAKEREAAALARQADEHAENLAALTRLEGGIARVESKILGGN